MLKPTAANMSSRASASRTAAVVKAPARGRCVAFRPVQRTGRPQLIVRAETEASEQFDVDSSKPPEQIENTPETLGPRDDDVLPANLADAVVCAAKATAAAIQRSNNLCQVEIHLPEFWDPISGPQFPNRGDQEKFWKMTRRFTEELSIALGTKKVKAVYPDAGVAAMLAYQWKGEVDFALSSLTDRRPVQPDDEVIVVACPDPQGASECMAMVATIMDQDEKALNPEGRPVILFNPRLSSGDVGLGLNARRMRSKFTDKFVVTYSLRPIGDYGSVFRCYPSLWQVFLEDESMPGRYKMVAERPGRPAGDALDYLIREVEMGAVGVDGKPILGPDGKPVTPKDMGLLDQLANTMNGIQRFMRSLSN